MTIFVRSKLILSLVLTLAMTGLACVAQIGEAGSGAGGSSAAGSAGGGSAPSGTAGTSAEISGGAGDPSGAARDATGAAGTGAAGGSSGGAGVGAGGAGSGGNVVAGSSGGAGAGAGTGGGADAGAPKDASTDGGNGYACTSGKMYTHGTGSDMEPGKNCLSCHKFHIAGTIYPSLHEPDKCDGVNVSGVSVVITDSKGVVTTLMPSVSSGNFHTSATFTPPYKAKVVFNGVVREMLTPQTIGACNSCHTADGANGAPGRIELP